MGLTGPVHGRNTWRSTHGFRQHGVADETRADEFRQLTKLAPRGKEDNNAKQL